MAQPAIWNITLTRGDSLNRRLSFYYQDASTGERRSMDLSNKNIMIKVKYHPADEETIDIPLNQTTEEMLKQGNILVKLTYEQIEELFNKDEYDSEYIYSLQMEEKDHPEYTRTTLVKGKIKISQNYASN
ncbi:hypothetical protein [Shewanella sp. SE1]|uniref:hypothetical protein n=1 Tax=Shewanella sp. SE1 TaxID=2705014 RepID=UPI00138F41EB|nr:hypothetical protein [Shewanella sp. SE1]NDO73075.1 hypothetical protein [Shewanella sp. SE1]